MSGNNASDLHCVLTHKLKIRPGTSSTLVQDVLLNCGSYIFTIEDADRRVSLLKSHNFANGNILIAGKEGGEILNSGIDFHKEHPFSRDIEILPPIQKDGASDEKAEAAAIRMILTLNSMAHIKSIRLRVKLLCNNESYQAHILSSNVSEQKREKGKPKHHLSHKDSSSKDSSKDSSSESTGSRNSTPSGSYADLPHIKGKFDSYSSQDDDSDFASDGNKHNIDHHVVEKDILYIQKNTTYTSEGVENNTTQIRVEHSKVVSENNNDNAGSTSSEKSNSNLISTSLSTTSTSTSTTAMISNLTTSTTSINSSKIDKSMGASSMGASSMGASTADDESLSNYSSSNSQSSFDPSEENLVYYKETKLRKKKVTTEEIPIQQKGRYYLVIESSEKGPINRHFSCHLTLTNSDNHVVKESYTNDAKRKICDDFTVDGESGVLKLKLANTNTSFGSTDLQLSLYMRNMPQEPDVYVHPYLRTGEVVWSVNKCEVEKKRPQKFTACIPKSGRYYLVVEKVDKIYGGLREISVTAMLHEPATGGFCSSSTTSSASSTSSTTGSASTSSASLSTSSTSLPSSISPPPQRECPITGSPARTSLVASAVVGGVKLRPMKWKSPVFVAPAGSTIDLTVESFALVGSIIYSLRIRKVPGLTAEEERTRKMVVLFLASFGIYYFLYIVISVIHFIQNIGFTFPLLFISVDITLGRICFILFCIWCRTNQEILIMCLKDVRDTIGKIARKIKYIRDMSDGGKFDILRIFKQMSKEGKANDLRKWEKQKQQTANE